MSTVSTRLRAVAVAAIALVALVGCGGSPVEQGSPAPADAATVAVSAVEYSYSMDTTEVPAGPVTFELTNDGTMSHDLVLEGGPGGNTGVIDPGEMDTFTATLEPGTYTLYCSVGNHRSLGMEITITVT